MPATGFTPIQLFHSSTSGTLPTTTQLFTGEIFWNIADNKVYGLNPAGTALQTIVGSLGNQNANTVAITGGSINGTTIGALTPSTGIFTTLVANTSVLSPIVGAGSGSNLSLQANSTTYATLDTSGNLGLSVTPNSWDSIYKAIQVIGASMYAYTGTTSNVTFATNSYQNASNTPTYIGSSPAALYQQINGAHSWSIAPSGTAGSPITFTQAMILDNSGNLLVGQTSAGGGASSGGIDLRNPSATTGGSSILITHNTSVGSGNSYAEFWFGSSNIGSILQNGTTAVLYNTTSDQRLKTDLGIASQSRILDVKIHDYEWKSDGSKARGVFAQEAHQVIPEAVSVGNDETDENGNLKKPWAVDYSKFVPDLIVQVQELTQLVSQLKAEIAELKGAK